MIPDERDPKPEKQRRKRLEERFGMKFETKGKHWWQDRPFIFPWYFYWAFSLIMLLALRNPEPELWRVAVLWVGIYVILNSIELIVKDQIEWRKSVLSEDDQGEA